MDLLLNKSNSMILVLKKLSLHTQRIWVRSLEREISNVRKIAVDVVNKKLKKLVFLKNL